MRSAYNKNIHRLIGATKGRFFSLTAIVCIGVAFFVGVSASSQVMAKSVDTYDDETGLKDITVYSDYGFSEKDIEAIQNLEHVSLAEGTYFVDVNASITGSTYVTRLHAYDPDTTINQVVLVSGRLPENEHEALSESQSGYHSRFEIGETVKLTRPDNDLSDFMSINEVTIVGTVETPLYLNLTKEDSTLSNQPLTTFLYIPKAAFNTDYYTEVNILLEDAKDEDSFGDTYADYDEQVKNEIEALATTQVSVRKDEVLDKAWSEYNDGLKEYEDGQKEFDEKIADAEKEITDGEQEIADGEQEIADAKQKLVDSQKELDEQQVSGSVKINDARAELSKAEGQLAEGKKELEEKKIEYGKQIEELKEKEALIDQAISGLDSAITAIQQLEGLDTLVSFVVSADPALDVNANLITELLGKAGNMHTDGHLTDEQYGGLTQGIASLEAQSGGTITDDSKIASLTGVAFNVPGLKPVINSVIITGSLNSSSSRIGDLLAAAGTQYRDGKLSNQEYYLLTQGVNEIIQGSSGTITENFPIAVLNGAISAAEDMVYTTLNSQMSTEYKTLDDLQNARAEMVSNRELIESGINQIEAGLADAQKQIDDAEAQIQKGYEECVNASVELDEKVADAQKQIDDGYAEIADNEADLAQAKIDIADAKVKLEDSRKDGQQELEDAKADLIKAKQDIEDLEDGKWTVLDRTTSHYASVTYKDTVNQMKAIAAIFPVFFFAVAALVCITTMTRMVDEQRGQIGILRALGYTRWHCTKVYLIYAMIATAVGMIIGDVIGLLIFPPVIYTAWQMMYVLPTMSRAIPWNWIILGDACFLGVMALATWYACRNDMKEVPSQLMRPKAPKLGKSSLIERVPMIWKHLSFTWKVTIRNLLRYKKRLFMTVIGVAGCTALLITGFGIRDSITTIVDTQFGVIYRYDGIVQFDKDLSVSETENEFNTITGRSDIAQGTQLGYYSAVATNQNGKEETVRTEVYDSASDVERTYLLRNLNTQKELTLSDDGIIISKRLGDQLNVGVGDTIRLESENGIVRDVTITGVCEMYIYHYVFMTQDYYQKTFGTSLQKNAAYIKLADGASSVTARQEISVMNGVLGTEFYDSVIENFQNMITGLNMIVVVLILSSLALCMVVLGNLTNVNINERQREIATLKVLGFRKKEVENYIFKENNILTALGAVCGIPMGIALHHYIMGQVEMDYIMFGRTISWQSQLLCVAMTIVFGMLVNLLMRKKFDHILMVESLKSVE